MSDCNLQQVILKNILNNESYMRKVAAYIKKDYFEGVHKFVFGVISSYIRKYNKLPNQQELKVEIDEVENCSEEMYSDSLNLIPSLYIDSKENEKWLIDRTESWCRERAIHNAILTSFDVITGREKKVTAESLPDLLSKALAVSFDSHIGHDYFENSSERFEKYHNKEEKIPFDIDVLNEITKGGLEKKTLTVFMAGTGVGKSLIMCHLASQYLMMGKNVLYITMEMSEDKIAERIDANILDIPIDQLQTLPKNIFDNRLDSIIQKTKGKLIIKEYPTAQAHTGHFRALLNELKLKKDFVPDILFVDYINICASSRIRSLGGSVGSYNLIKAIAEELRGLAVEFELPLITATQTTRYGSVNDDPDLTDTSESFGLPATADLFLAVISNEELNAMCAYLCKQLKNRYANMFNKQRFMVGVDKSKMKLHDMEQDNSPKEEIPVYESNSKSKVRTSGLIV